MGLRWRRGRRVGWGVGSAAGLETVREHGRLRRDNHCAKHVHRHLAKHEHTVGISAIIIRRHRRASTIILLLLLLVVPGLRSRLEQLVHGGLKRARTRVRAEHEPLREENHQEYAKDLH
jgi:hypothetical protein